MNEDSSKYIKEDVKGKRIGIIGLDAFHGVAFTKILNATDASSEYAGYKVVAAYPKGSKDLAYRIERVPEYTKAVEELGVEIVESIEELLDKVDVVLLESNDARVHLEQAIPVLKAGKKMFIDKPIADSLEHTNAIFDASEKYNVPVFSSSALRFIETIRSVNNGSVGKVLGAHTYSPAYIEPSLPDLLWYAIHGIEMLFAVMGTGCRTVRRFHSENAEVLVGVWEGDRIGTFRGIRKGKMGYGGSVFGENGNTTLGTFKGYEPLVSAIIQFFETGVPPVSKKETLEIISFIMAAEESKKRGGLSVDINKL